MITPTTDYSIHRLLPGPRLYGLPSRTSPRLILTQGAWRQRWNESRWLPAYRWTARLWRLAVRLRYTMFPGTARLAETAGGVGENITTKHTKDTKRDAGGMDTYLPSALRRVVRVGTADARQKLTVLMHDGRGNLCRVAKVGFLPLARELVEREGVVLQALPTGLGPRFLGCGELTTNHGDVEGDLTTKDTKGDVGGKDLTTKDTKDTKGGVRETNLTTKHTKDTKRGLRNVAAEGRIVVFEPVQGRGLPARLPKSAAGCEWRDIDAFLARLVVNVEGELTTKHTKHTKGDVWSEVGRTVPVSREAEERDLTGRENGGKDYLTTKHTKDTKGDASGDAVFRDFRVFRSPSSFVPASQHPALKRLASAHPKAEEWIAALGDREWPVVIEHGDFAPWNLLRTPAGLRAIDWEDARLEGFPGFDLVHYVIQTGFLMHHWDAMTIRAYADARLRDTGVTAQEAAAVVKLAALQDVVVTAEGEQTALQSIRQELLLLSE